MAPATRRTLSKVKSSAIRPRQPSVPNLIWGIGRSLVVRRSRLVVRYSLFVVGICESRTTNSERRLHQFLQLLFIQMLYYLANVLRLIERSNQQSVFGFDNHQVADADQCNEF